MSKQRYVTLTVGAGLVVELSAIFLVGAPPIPATIGIALAVGWLIWRGPLGSAARLTRSVR